MTLRDEIVDGLHGRSLPPKLFYDAVGSELFEQITRLPEYYPTRCEIEILRDHGDEIAGWLGPDVVLIEPGSGNSQKVQRLLDHLERPRAYVPVEISSAALAIAVQALASRWPSLPVHPVHADYSSWFHLPDVGGRRVAFYPGSTIGNFDPPNALAFLERLRAIVGPGGGLVVGVDLEKDKEILDAAYNDAAGITAAFNKNMLAHINRLTGADFDLARWSHQAEYDPFGRRIQMHLRSEGAQVVHVDGERFSFRDGELIHTENSYKWTLDDFANLVTTAGFEPMAAWTDQHGWFSVQYLVAR